MTMNELFGDVIYAYTREDAIRDGQQIELDPKMVREAGFKFPVSMTATAFERCVAWTREDNTARKMQDQKGRMWDVLYMLHTHIKRTGVRGNTVLYQLYVVPKTGRGYKATLTTLKAVIGPMGPRDPRPCITIMEVTED